VLIELNVNFDIYLIGFTHILLNINLTTFSEFYLKVGKSIVKHKKIFFSIIKFQHLSANPKGFIHS